MTQATRLQDLPRHQRRPHEHYTLRDREALRRLDLIEQQHSRRSDRALSALVGATLLLGVVSAAGLIYLATGGPI